MNKFFNMDNTFFSFMSRVADLMLLNILFIICCLPVVTIGSSITAMYYVTLKMVRNEESYIAKSFFKSFRENFKQSTILWLIMLVAGILIFIDFNIVNQIQSTLTTIVRYGLYFITFIYLLILIYLFPVLSKFYNSIKNTFQNALLMSIRHLPFSILLIVIWIAPIVITFIHPTIFMYSLLVWILIGFSLLSFLCSLLLVKVFDHYMPKEEEATPKEDGAIPKEKDVI